MFDNWFGVVFSIVSAQLENCLVATKSCRTTHTHTHKKKKKKKTKTKKTTTHKCNSFFALICSRLTVLVLAVLIARSVFDVLHVLLHQALVVHVDGGRRPSC